MKLADLVNFIPPTPKSVKVFVRKYWQAKIGKVEAKGNTSDEAVTALKAVITTTFDGNYDPIVLSFRNIVGIGWRTPWQWEYKIIEMQDLTAMRKLQGCTSFETEDEVRNHLRSHMAQWAWDKEEETSPIIEDAEDQDRFSRWAYLQKSGR